MASLTIQEVLKEAQAQLSDVLVLPATEARLEAQILLQECLKVNRAWLLTHGNDVLEGTAQAVFDGLLQRRSSGQPIAYILGKREFYGLEFKVTPDTLIPRPDTETLVDVALKRIPQGKAFRVLDLGTGTGAIAIAIAKHRPLAQVTAVDASAAALAVAQHNARILGAVNVQFVLSNWLSELEGQTFDLIVSNPPYVAENDLHLNQGDLRFEPLTALAAGEDGLDDIRHIISQAMQHLEPQGWLMFEHGYDQSELVMALMKAAGFSATSSVADLAGVLRVTMGQRLP